MAEQKGGVISLRRSRRGFVLVLFLMLLVSILGAVAFAIDLCMYFSVASSAEQVVRYMALTALEQQLQSGSVTSAIQGGAADTTTSRLHRGMNDAGWFAKNNRLPWSARPQGFSTYEEFSGSFENFDQVVFSPGVYVTSRDKKHAAVALGLTCDRGGCSSTDDAVNCRTPDLCTYPSFDNVSSPNDVGINAMKVKGFVYEPFLFRFARLLGIEKKPVAVKALAYNVPAEFVIVTDISSSTFAETHLRRDEGAIKRSEFAFPSYCEGPDSAGGQRCKGVLDPEGGTIAPPSGASVPAGPKYETWNELAAERTAGADAREHFKSDYNMPSSNPLVDGAPFADDVTLHDALRVNTNPYGDRLNPPPSTSDRRYNPNYYAGSLLLDQFRSSSYRGPESFTTILRGVYYLLREFNEMSVAGNRVGLIFFEGHTLQRESPYKSPLGSTRIFGTTEHLDLLLGIFREVEGNPNSTNISGANGLTAGISKTLAKYGVYPSVGSHTDIYSALLEAKKHLYASRQNNIRTRQRILLISDGLSTCVHKSELTRNCLFWEEVDYLKDGVVGEDDGRECVESTDPNCVDAFDLDRDGIVEADEIQDVNRHFGNCHTNPCGDPGAEGSPEEFNHLYCIGASTRACQSASPPASCSGKAVECRETAGFFFASMNQVLTLARFSRKYGIPIDTIFVGSPALQPHTLAVGINDPDASGGIRCATQDEAKQHNWPIVNRDPRCDGGGVSNTDACRAAFANRSEADPFLDAGYLLMVLAWASGGEFYPIYNNSPGCVVDTSCVASPHGSPKVRTSHPRCHNKAKQFEEIMQRAIERSGYTLINPLPEDLPPDYSS